MQSSLKGDSMFLLNRRSKLDSFIPIFHFSTIKDFAQNSWGRDRSFHYVSVLISLFGRLLLYELLWVSESTLNPAEKTLSAFDFLKFEQVQDKKIRK